MPQNEKVTLPEGTGGLLSWAEAEGVGQAKPVNVAAASRLLSMADFIGGISLVGFNEVRK
jgi:hypothetical protein